MVYCFFRATGKYSFGFAFVVTDLFYPVYLFHYLFHCVGHCKARIGILRYGGRPTRI